MNKKLAALDIGTNSFHLIVVSVSSTGNFEIIDREKEVIRLSEGNIGDIKEITVDSTNRAISAINRFNKIAESHGASLRATATSAVRESLNKNEFLEDIFNSTGVQIEVISGLEEARLIHLGILKAVPVFDLESLSIDIGGGSTEFIVGNKGEIKYSNSLKLGAVRLTQRFFPDYILTDEKINEARKWVEGVITPVISNIKSKNIEAIVGSSGTILNIGMMISALQGAEKGENPILNNFEFSVNDLREIETLVLSKKTPKERKSIAGLEEKRIDIIPAGVIIISEILKKLEAKKLIISDYALREGIILDSMDKLGICEGKSKLHNIRIESVKQLAESSKYDFEHCYNVAKLSVKLFDQLVALGQIDETGREYLEAASILHDIGYHISHSKHHKHSYYMIRNSSILGFNDTEIEIIANIARYHRKSHPKKLHEGFNKLSEINKELVKKLSGILRVTDAFDRTHKSKIIEFKTSVNEDSVIIELHGLTENPEVELWSFDRRKSLFEEVFNRKIIVIS